MTPTKKKADTADAPAKKKAPARKAPAKSRAAGGASGAKKTAASKPRAPARKPAGAGKAAAGVPRRKPAATTARRPEKKGVKPLVVDADEEASYASSVAVDSALEEDEELARCVDDGMADSDYSEASDVFEDDVEALQYQDAQEERAQGFADVLMEEPTGIVDYPYPAYLAKLPSLFTDSCAFGKTPEQYIYCHNLLVRRSGPSRGRRREPSMAANVPLAWQINPQRFPLVDKAMDDWERAQLASARRSAALARRQEEKRRQEEACVQPDSGAVAVVLS